MFRPVCLPPLVLAVLLMVFQNLIVPTPQQKKNCHIEGWGPLTSNLHGILNKPKKIVQKKNCHIEGWGPLTSTCMGF